MEDIQNIKGKDRKQQIFNYINNLDLNAEQKRLLMKKIYKTYRSYDDNFYNTINNSNLTIQEKENLKNFLKIGE
jgi:DNA polymerase III delta prime subunit